MILLAIGDGAAKPVDPRPVILCNVGLKGEVGARDDLLGIVIDCKGVFAFQLHF